ILRVEGEKDGVEKEPTAVGMSQAQLEELVAGVDFEDDLSWEDDISMTEATKVATSSRSPIIPTLRAPPTPRSPLPRIHHRPDPPSPLSPHGKTDLFSPEFHPAASTSRARPPSRSSSPFILSPLRRSSPSADASRQFTTTAAEKAAPPQREEIVLDSDPESFDIDEDMRAFLRPSRREEEEMRAIANTEGEERRGIVIADSDSEVEILPSKRNLVKKVDAAIKGKMKATLAIEPPKPKASWFTKPDNYKPPTSSAPASKARSTSLKPTSSTVLAPAPSATRVKSPTPPPAPLTYTEKKRATAKAKEEKEKKLKESLKEFKFDKWGLKPPRLVYSKDEVQIKKELEAMTGPLGFDIEWEPFVRKKGSTGKAGPGKTALAQVCDGKTILLVHLAKMKVESVSDLSPSLRALIEDPNRIKLGVQIAGDGRKLKADFGYKPAGLLELNNVARLVDAQHWVNRTSYGLIGLQNLCAMYLDRYLPKDKKVRCGAWAAELSTEQKYYGANDVYSSLQIFLYLQEQAESGVDVLALASDNLSTASSWRPPTSALGSKVPDRVYPFELDEALDEDDESDSGPVKTRTVKTAAEIKPITLASGKPRPRELEAYKLWHLEGLDPEGVAEKMSASRSIKPLSVIFIWDRRWNVLGCLSKDAALEFDDTRLIESMAEVSAETHSSLMRDHGEFVGEAIVSGALEQRLKGNEHFKKGELTEALREYHAVLMALRGVSIWTYEAAGRAWRVGSAGLHRTKWGRQYGTLTSKMSSSTGLDSFRDLYPVNSASPRRSMDRLLPRDNVLMSPRPSAQESDEATEAEGEVPSVSELAIGEEASGDGLAKAEEKKEPEPTIQEKAKNALLLTYLNMSAFVLILSHQKELRLLTFSVVFSVLIKNLKYKRALECAQDALKLDENNPKAKFREAQARIGLGQLSMGKAIFEELQKKSPDIAIERELKNLAASEKAGEAKKMAAFRGMYARKPVVDEVLYLRSDLQEVSEELEHLQGLDEANQVFSRAGTRSRPSAKVAIELEVDRFVKESHLWRKEQQKDSQKVEDMVATHQLQERRRVEKERKEVSAEHVFEPLRKRSKMTTIEEDDWVFMKADVIKIFNRTSASREKRIATQNAERAAQSRQALLQPFYESIKASTTLEPKFFPPFSDFADIPSVKIFWEAFDASINSSAFDKGAKAKIIRHVGSYPEKLKHEVYTVILSANGTSSYHLRDAVAVASSESSFFDRFTSTLMKTRPYHKSTFGSFPAFYPLGATFSSIAGMSNANLVTLLRTVLEAAELDDLTTLEEVESRELKFYWAEYTGRGRGKAKLDWRQIAQRWFPCWRTKRTLAPPTLTLAESSGDADFESDAQETDEEGSDAGDEERSGGEIDSDDDERFRWIDWSSEEEEEET
ncbi:hypothetical protein P7C70_g5802, partial [Phenoliferia sp. Uapishka_3]